jgi:hypothetical protein
MHERRHKHETNCDLFGYGWITYVRGLPLTLDIDKKKKDFLNNPFSACPSAPVPTEGRAGRDGLQPPLISSIWRLRDQPIITLDNNIASR